MKRYPHCHTGRFFGDGPGLACRFPRKSEVEQFSTTLTTERNVSIPAHPWLGQSERRRKNQGLVQLLQRGPSWRPLIGRAVSGLLRCALGAGDGCTSAGDVGSLWLADIAPHSGQMGIRYISVACNALGQTNAARRDGKSRGGGMNKTTCFEHDVRLETLSLRSSKKVVREAYDRDQCATPAGRSFGRCEVGTKNTKSP